MQNRFRSKSERAVAAIQTNFLSKFKGKTNFVSKEGVMCILFKEEEQADIRRSKCKTELTTNSEIRSHSVSDAERGSFRENSFSLPLLEKNKRRN